MLLEKSQTAVAAQELAHWNEAVVVRGGDYNTVREAVAIKRKQRT
jgi:hypothetical protein